MNFSLRKKLFFGLSLLLLAVFFYLSMALGSEEIPQNAIWSWLWDGGSGNGGVDTVIERFRFPRTITAIFAGASLAVSGLILQTWFKNPLAGPFVLGISSGASLGVAVLMLGAVLFQGAAWLNGSYTTAMAASLGAGSVMLIVLFLSRWVSGRLQLLVVGLMLGYLSGALVNLLVYFSDAETLQGYMYWTMGSFTAPFGVQIWILGASLLVGGLGAMLSVRALDAFMLGDAYAETLGINIRRTRWIVLASASLLAGSVTAFCGPIGFLGIAVPHFCRGILKTSRHRYLIPACLLGGALLALAAQVLSLMPKSPLPLNAVTSLLGAPVVIWVMLRRRK